MSLCSVDIATFHFCVLFEYGMNFLAGLDKKNIWFEVCCHPEMKPMQRLTECLGSTEQDKELV